MSYYDAENTTSKRTCLPITIDDVLNSFPDPELVKKTFNEYNEFRKTGITRFITWRRGYKPNPIKITESLEKRGLIPLNDDSEKLGIIKEIYLYNLFCGSIIKKPTTYNILFKGNKDEMINLGEVLSQNIPGLGCNVSEKEKINRILNINSKDRKDPISVGLAHLIATLKNKTKSENNISKYSLIPDFIEDELIIFYAFNLKSRKKMNAKTYTLSLGGYSDLEESRQIVNSFAEKLKELNIPSLSYCHNNTTNKNFVGVIVESSIMEEFLNDYAKKTIIFKT